MSALAGSQQHCAAVSRRLKLDTIPPEIRGVIYTHLCNPLSLFVSPAGKLDLKDYPWQLSAVSRLIRNEILPTLYGETQARPLQLVCGHGRFPDGIRRRIPNRVLYGINIIVLSGELYRDDVKPSLTSFPNLREFRLDMEHINDFGATLLFPGAKYAFEWLSEATFEDVLKRFKRLILAQAKQMKIAQEMPREGLERDYIVDGTLFDVLTMGIRRRGYSVTLLATMCARACAPMWSSVLAQATDHEQHCVVAELRVNSWDEDIGTLTREVKDHFTFRNTTT